jgi:hypothetical protein
MVKKRKHPATRATTIIAIVKNVGYAIFGMYLIWVQSNNENPQIAILAIGLLLCGFPIAEVSELLQNLATNRWSSESEEVDEI